MVSEFVRSLHKFVEFIMVRFVRGCLVQFSKSGTPHGQPSAWPPLCNNPGFTVQALRQILMEFLSFEMPLVKQSIKAGHYQANFLG